MTNPLSQDPTDATEQLATVQPVARRAYQKPEVTLFGSVEEFTRGAGTSPVFDAKATTRRTG